MEEESSSNHHQDRPWRVLEFYSGIGGMRYSIMKASVNAMIVEAFDINDVANDVYEYNFGHSPYQGNIQTLSAADLDSYRAHAWLLSPPCQPYTRQGLQKGSADARASSFLKILELIPETSQPPLMIFVENVVGFETSDTHRIMIEILAKADFVTQEFILSPLQFGVPYSRPHYFCLFPVECSLPWMLVDHMIESQNAGLLESVLMPFDIYNDSAQQALVILKQRFLYDEIEAEVDHCFDIFVSKLCETIFTYYKSWAASCLRLVKEHLNWGSKSELKAEVLRGIKEIGSVLYWMGLLDIVLREVDITHFMQTAPWLGLIPGADGQILQSQDGGDSPIVTLFKSATSAAVSNPGFSNPTAFYTISKQAEAAEVEAAPIMHTQKYAPSVQAKRKAFSFQSPLVNNQLLWSPRPLFEHEANNIVNESNQPQESYNQWLQACEPIENFLEFKNPMNQVEMGSGFLHTTVVPTNISESDEGNGSDVTAVSQYFVPLSLIERWGNAMDIVYPDSKRCCCFTKSYYRYVKGTGSFLATVLPKTKDEASSLEEQCLRYFTPREVANLHSFPRDFSFPQSISLRQRLSVAVVAPLLGYLFTEPS